MNEDTCEKILVTGGGISFNNQIPSDSSNTGPTEQKPKGPNSRDYYCDVCETTMTGVVTYKSHIAGARHLKNVENMKIGEMRSRMFAAKHLRECFLHIEGECLSSMEMKTVLHRNAGSNNLLMIFMKSPRETGSMKRKTKSTLPEVMGTKPGRDIFPTTKAILEKCSKPLIGMSFITECQVSDGNYEPRYLCGLCQGKCDPRTLLSHILGGKHRIAYFKEKYPEYYGEVFKDKTMRKSEVSPIIERCALLVEKAEGRQLMKTIIDNDIIENCFTKTKADDSHRGRGRGTSSFSRGFSQTLPRGREQTFNSRGSRGGAMSSRGSRGGFSSRGLGNGSSGRGQRGGGERGNYSSRGQRGFGGRGQVRGSRGRGQRGSFSPSPRGGFGRGRGRGQMKQESYGWPGDSYWEQSAYGDTGYGDMGYSDVGYGDTAYGDSGYGMLGSRYYEEQYYHDTGHQKYPSGRGGYAEPRYRPYPRGRGGVDPHSHPIGPGAPSQPPAGGNETSESSALLNLAKCLVSNEDEAKAALQISNKLAEALLEYHRRKEPSQADHGPSGHGNSVQGNPQGDMSGNVQGGTMETNLCGYAAPEVDYNHGYGGNMGGNMDYSLTETIEAPAQPFTGDYSYAQPW